MFWWCLDGTTAIYLLVFDCLVKQNYKTQFNYTSTRKKTKTKRKRTNISRKIDDKVLHEMKVTRMDFNKKEVASQHLIWKLNLEMAGMTITNRAKYN